MTPEFPGKQDALSEANNPLPTKLQNDGRNIKEYRNKISGSKQIVTVECLVVESVAVFHALANLTLSSFLVSSISIKFFALLIVTYFIAQLL
jgi:hypothetical protein